MKPIKTKRFVLRPYKMSDAKSIAVHLNNRKVTDNLSSLPFPYEEKHAREFIGKMRRKMKKENPTDYVLTIEIDGSAVGSVGAHHITKGHKAEIGYWLGEPYWGQGIMPEAVTKFLEHVFKEFKLKRAYARVYASNKGSMRVAEKVGMQFEGVAKKEALKNGKYIDTHTYAKVK